MLTSAGRNCRPITEKNVTDIANATRNTHACVYTYAQNVAVIAHASNTHACVYTYMQNVTDLAQATRMSYTRNMHLHTHMCRM